jgi:GMP synthase-like glutamine amidotransferase
MAPGDPGGGGGGIDPGDPGGGGGGIAPGDPGGGGGGNVTLGSGRAGAPMVPARATVTSVRVLHVHHDPNSLPGLVADVLDDLGADQSSHQVCHRPGSPQGGTDFPDPARFDQVVLHGSRWSTYDAEVAHWVRPELDFARAADRAGVAVLGLCFGGQLLAAAHGARVAPTDHPEIGWHEVDPVPGHVDGRQGIERGPWLQWHFDAFEVPAGATGLARSRAGAQAFRLRRNLGLQFHPEADRAVLEAWLTDDRDQLRAAGVDPDELLAGADRHLTAARGRADRLVRWWLAESNDT